MQRKRIKRNIIISQYIVSEINPCLFQLKLTEKIYRKITWNLICLPHIMEFHWYITSQIYYEVYQRNTSQIQKRCFRKKDRKNFLTDHFLWLTHQVCQIPIQQTQDNLGNTFGQYKSIHVVSYQWERAGINYVYWSN